VMVWPRTDWQIDEGGLLFPIASAPIAVLTTWLTHEARFAEIQPSARQGLPRGGPCGAAYLAMPSYHDDTY